MGTIQNTAALYLRKSSLDDRAGDNRSITDQRHDLLRLAERNEGWTQESAPDSMTAQICFSGSSVRRSSGRRE